MRSINLYIAAILMSSSLVGVPSASLVLADDLPSQGNPSDVIQGDAGKGAGAQETAPAASPPTMQGEPGQPAEAGEVQERGLLGGIGKAVTAPITLPFKVRGVEGEQPAKPVPETSTAPEKSSETKGQLELMEGAVAR